MSLDSNSEGLGLDLVSLICEVLAVVTVNFIKEYIFI